MCDRAHPPNLSEMMPAVLHFSWQLERWLAGESAKGGGLKHIQEHMKHVREFHRVYRQVDAAMASKGNQLARMVVVGGTTEADEFTKLGMTASTSPNVAAWEHNSQV